jgi:hypothetical protein
VLKQSLERMRDGIDDDAPELVGDRGEGSGVVGGHGQAGEGSRKGCEARTCT